MYKASTLHTYIKIQFGPYRERWALLLEIPVFAVYGNVHCLL